ncbi:hypothetical protein SK128_006185 [Halocaridina rubra]|uniref:Uncharacterized protein n=1 Tax=Halocaridina rubra TaxID=373956 RepID=A0AAN8XUW8_HALRR
MMLVLGILVEEAMPQSGISIDNNTLLALGAVVVASGIAYHVGRQSAANGQNGGQPFGFPFFGGRRRRQADTADPLNELDPLVEELFKMALAKDSSNCSLQLVCSIGRKPSSNLTGHAKNLYGVLSANEKSDEPTTKGSWHGLDAYRIALNLGRDGGNCSQLFPRCPNSSKQLMNTFQNMHTVDN